MKISIFGTGYVGLVTGTCLAELGHDVICVDIDEKKIEGLREGVIPIYEPGLEELVVRNSKEGRLEFTTDAQQAIERAQVVFNAVGTPPGDDGHADLKYVRKVAQTCGQYMNGHKTFVNKSTVPVGTGQMCQEEIQKQIDSRIAGGEDMSALTFSVVSNPEFLKEGSAIKDFLTPDRIVCGVSDEQAGEVMKKVYQSLVRADKPLVITDVKSAELIKYAANSFLATKISFINEIANFAELVGANVSDVARGIGLDARIGPRFLHAGIGYGGSCFPKDVQALIASGDDVGYSFEIIKATERVNKTQRGRLLSKLSSHVPDLAGKTIAVRGVSFKPKTDDVRDAPSHDLFDALIDAGVERIQAFDPIAMHEMETHYGKHEKIVYTDRSYDAVLGADALVLLTERDEFRHVDMKKVSEMMRTFVIIDGRNIWTRSDIEELGGVYEGIGR